VIQKWQSRLGAIRQGLKPIVFSALFGTAEVVP
jgi:hypothetical protein